MKLLWYVTIIIVAKVLYPIVLLYLIMGIFLLH